MPGASSGENLYSSFDMKHLITSLFFLCLIHAAFAQTPEGLFDEAPPRCLQVPGLGGEQAESCFWQAFQHCRPATLAFTAGASAKFHTTLKHTFTIHNENGTCLITDVQQIGASSNTTNSICTGLVRHPRALDVLSCGQEGTVAVLGA